MELRVGKVPDPMEDTLQTEAREDREQDPN